MPGNLFWPCDEKRETRTSCDDWNVGKKTQQEKIYDELTKWFNVRQGA